MPAPGFHPREQAAGSPAQAGLFDRILERVQHDLPHAIGLAATVYDKNRGVTTLAVRGIAGACIDALRAGSRGPLMDAAEYQVPVLCPDIWADDRWPALTLDSVADAQPEQEQDLRRVRGVVAVPGVWQGEQTVILSCVLDQKATAATVSTLLGYEQLISAAMVAAATQDSGQISDMLAVLQSRGAIEQAKGVIIGLLRCDAGTAWQTLRRASHESNVKLRVLAVALIEHISGVPAEQPDSDAIVPDAAARKAAAMLWAVLSHAAAAESVTQGDPR